MNKVIGGLITICLTAWAVVLGLGLFGVIGPHDARSAGEVLGVATLVGAALVGLATQF